MNRYKMFWKYSSRWPQLAAHGRLPRLVKAASASRAVLAADITEESLDIK